MKKQHGKRHKNTRGKQGGRRVAGNAKRAVNTGKPLLVAALLLVLAVGLAVFGLSQQNVWPVFGGENPPPSDTAEPPPDETATAEPEAEAEPEPELPFTAAVSGTVADEGNLLTEQQRALLQDFMLRWYTPLAYFDEPSFGGVFSEKETLERHEGALRTLITIRRAALTDLRMLEVDWTLSVKSAQVQDDGYYAVEAEETTAMRFAATPQVESLLFDLPHEFLLDISGQTPTLVWHDADDNPYFSYQYEEGESMDATLSRIQRAIQRRQLLQGETAEVTLKCDHPYDRAAALDYMRTYAEQRSEYWPSYDDIGGNCMNFGSQVLYAGGIPMDYSGDEMWYWHDRNDLKLSWINVGDFYNYARKNEGAGLVADTEAGYYTGQEGDILILGANGDHSHTTLISGVLYNDEGRVVDYLLCSNTTNYRDFPAGAYYYTSHRLVKIYGWND